MTTLAFEGRSNAGNLDYVPLGYYFGDFFCELAKQSFSCLPFLYHTNGRLETVQSRQGSNRLQPASYGQDEDPHAPTTVHKVDGEAFLITSNDPYRNWDSIRKVWTAVGPAGRAILAIYLARSEPSILIQGSS